MDEPIWTSRNRRPVPIPGTPDGIALVDLLARLRREAAAQRALRERDHKAS